MIRRGGKLLLHLLAEPEGIKDLHVGQPGVNPLLYLDGTGDGVRALHAAIGE
jgi:hypothetical protein